MTDREFRRATCTPVTREKDPALGLIAAAFALVVLGASLFGPYGYFIDEFYYLACARHPAAGYVDHPPLAPLLLALIRAVFGESMFALRLVPSIAAGATVYVTGRLAHEWGGGRFAGRLAALAATSFPLVAVVGSFYSMNAFEALIWALATLLISKIIRGGDQRLWLAVGALLGIGFELKHTIVVFVAGAFVGLVATRARKLLWSRWLLIGAGLAFLIALPNLLWQLTHHFVSLDFYRQATVKKNIGLAPLGVLGQQLLVLHPLLVPIWGTGAIGLLAARRFRDQRWIGIGWWTLLGVLMISGASRPDRITGFGPALFAAGSIACESWMVRPIGRAALAVYVVIAGLLLAPLNLPLLPFETTARYAAFTHAVPKLERGKSSPLPQWLADRTGWEAFAAHIRQVFEGLSGDERARVRFFAPDYGEAGAIEHFIPELSVISPHNSYWDFSLGHTDSDVYIVVDVDEKTLREMFDEVTRVGTTSCTYCMSWRSGNPIWVVRKSRVPLSTRWNELKNYE